MSSLVLDVLKTTGELEAADLKEKINNIQKEIDTLKIEVKEFIEDNYINFLPTLQHDQALIERTEKLINEMKLLHLKIEDHIKIELSGSIKELKNLSKALNASNLSLQLSSTLLELEKLIKTVEKLQEQKDYVNAAKTLKNIQLLLDDQAHGDLSLLNVYSTLRDTYKTIYGALLTAIFNLWEEYICWEDTTEGETIVISLTISNNCNEIQNVILALYYLDDLSKCLQHFANKLSKYIIDPIIKFECSVFVHNQKTFKVTHTKTKNTLPYKSVLHNVKMLFTFIHEFLNVDIEGNKFLNCLNEHLWNQLSETLINDCISTIIPTTKKELIDFDVIKTEINSFEDFLVGTGFISKHEMALSEYVKNVDQLYIDKVCQDVLRKACELAKKNLFDTFKHVPVENTGNVTDDWKTKYGFSKNTLTLPTCQVCISVKELLEFLKNNLQEATVHPSQKLGIKLYYTCRNAVEYYLKAVLEYHKNFLETIPQQVALFHNSCIYLSHHLLLVHHEFHKHIKDLHKYNFTFIDLAMKSRDIGLQTFVNHTKYQRNIIFDIIKNSNISQLEENLPPTVERAVRQCIRQLKLLKTVWFNVLPINVYCKTLGLIVNSLIDELILKVVYVEDISASAATELVDLLNMLVNNVPEIFPNDYPINKHVSKWQKLLELIKVLEGSLRDIEERWANGNGPLAKEFTSSQLKQLIRALFQNTERRSTFLSAIK